MKKLIFILFFPLFVFSQSTERQQKEQVRSTGTYNPSPTLSQSPKYSFSQQNTEYFQKNITRDQNRNYYNNNNPRQVFITNPYYNNWGWGFNRWNPTFGWNSYNPFFWYDDWGWRNPGRVYIYDNGRRDTIKAQPLHGSFGLSYNMSHEYGIWMTMGRNFYFIGEFSRTNDRDISVFYPNLTLDKVLPWDDRKLNDYVKTQTFSFGVGKKIDKVMGVHAMLGFGRIERRYRFYDELFVLSNNGEYTFPNYRKNITDFKVGTTLSVSRVLMGKLDWNITGGDISFGIGLKF